MTRGGGLALLLLVLGALVPAGAAFPDAEPGDPLDLAWRQALGENDLEGAMAAFEAAADDPSRRAEARFGRALLRLARGEDEAAAESLGAVIEADPSSPLAAAAAGAFLDLQPFIRRGGAGREETLLLLAGGGTGADPEAVDMARRALRVIRERRGEEDALTRAARERGALMRFALLGPFGRFDHLALDRAFAPERGILALEGEPPGPDGLTPFRLDGEFPTGLVVVPPPFRMRGVVYAAADLQVARPLTALLRVASLPSLKVFLDGKEVLVLDRRREWAADARRVELELPRGRHRLLVKVENSEPHARFEALLTDAEGLPLGPDLVEIHLPEGGHPAGPVRATPSPVAPLEELGSALEAAGGETDPARLLALALLAESLGDLGLRRASIEEAAAAWPGSALAQYELGRFFHYAPTGLDGAQDLARARTAYRAALEAEELPMALFRLSVMDWEEGRRKEAVAALARCEMLVPDGSRWPMALHRLASERGWLLEAREALERARERLPDGPEVLLASLEEAQNAGDVVEVRRLTRELASQDALDDSFAMLLAHEGHYEEAEAVWRRIAALVPTSLDPLLAMATARREAGDYAGAAELLERAITRFPAESGLLLRHAFLLELLGEGEAAEERYRQALRHDPARLEVVRHLRRRSGFDPDFGYQVDAARVMAEAPEPEEGTDSGLLLDQSITWVDSTGGALERYHALIQVYTRAGVEQNSQPQVPPGSRYLGLRVIKPDGTTYEPDPRDGGEVTLPNLEPGDFFEYRYERYQPPSAQVPGAYDNDVLFVFQGGQRPYVLSQYVLIHDASLEIRADGRFEGLEIEDRREGDLRIRSWTARDMPSLRLEPGIPNIFDMSPHVRLTYRIDWEDVADYLRDGWTPLLRPTPEMRQAARRIGESAEGTLERARAVHDHVTESVRPAGPSIDFATPASVSYSSGRGNRVLVAKALFELLGVESELVVARPVPEKGVFLDSPNPNQFSYPLLRVRAGGTEAYLDLVDSDHPFDRIPFFLRGSDALVVPATDEEAPRIEILPEGGDEPPRFGLEADLRLSEDGSVSGHALQSFRDVAADQLRQNLRTVPESQRRQVYARVADLLFPGAVVSRASARGLEEVSGSVTLDLEWEGGSFGGGDGSRLRVPVVIRPLGLRRSWASLESRRFPLLIDDPESLEETYRIEAPAGYRLERVPEAVEVDGEFGRYRLEIGVEDGLLTVRRAVELPYQRIEPEDYPRFVAFAGTIDRAEQRLLEFLR